MSEQPSPSPSPSPSPNPFLALILSLVVALVAGSLSGFFASRNVHEQISSTFRQQQLQTIEADRAEAVKVRRTAYDQYLVNEEKTWEEINLFFAAADDIAHGRSGLATSRLVTATTWTPTGYRMVLEQLRSR
jgi:hypothetical protein